MNSKHNTILVAALFLIYAALILSSAQSGLVSASTERTNVGVPYNQVIAESANFSATNTQIGALYNVTTGTNSLTATIPLASSAGNGATFYFRKTDSSSGSVVVDNVLLAEAGHMIEIVSDGTNWYARPFFGGIDSSGNITMTALGGMNLKGSPVEIGGNAISLGGALTTSNTLYLGGNQAATGAWPTSFGSGPPPGSVINVIGESIAAGVPVVNVDGSGHQDAYTGPGYCTFQWLSAQPGFTTTPIFDYGVSGMSSTGGLAVLTSTNNFGTEYLDGAVVGSYGGVKGQPSANLATGGGHTYWCNTFDGTDDKGAGNSPATYLSNMKSLWASERGYGGSPIIVGSSSIATAKYIPSDIQPYDSNLLSQLNVLSSSNQPIGIDILSEPGLTFQNNTDQNFYASDDTHLVSEGCYYFSVSIANAIMGNIGTPPLYLSNNQYSAGVIASTNVAASTNSISTLVTYTPTVTQTFFISSYINITAISSTTDTLEVTYTDENSNSETKAIPCSGTSGAWTAALTSTGDNSGSIMTIRALANNAITVKTVVTGASTTYDAGASIRPAGF